MIMKKLVALGVVLSVVSSVTALAAPQTTKPSTKSTTKVVDLWTCPITGEAVTNHTVKAGDPVVGKYRVHFCCGGCPEAFAKLSAKDKQTKVAAIAKKAASTAKKS